MQTNKNITKKNKETDDIKLADRLLLYAVCSYFDSEGMLDERQEENFQKNWILEGGYYG